MAERWLGIVVSSDRVILVDAQVDGASDCCTAANGTPSYQQNRET
jgi:hypothetical protein